MSILRNEITNQQPAVVQELPPAPVPTASEAAMSEENLEGAIVSLIVKNPRFEAASELSPRDFGIGAFRSIFTSLQRLNQRGVAIDAISLWEDLDAHKDTEQIQSIERLSEAINSPAVFTEDAESRFATYAELLKERSRKKELLRIADYLRSQLMLGQSEGHSVEELSSLFGKAEASASRLSVDEDEETLQETGDRLMEFYEFGDDTKRIPTGIKSLDDQINGGFLPEKVITIGANSGYGKSVLGIQIALNAAMVQDLRTVFFSLEMGRDEAINRANAAMCQIPFHVLTDNKADPNARYRRLEQYELRHLRQNMDRLVNGSLTIEDQSRLSTSQLRSYLSRARAEGKPYRMVLLDYLGQMEADRRYDEERLRITAIMEDLKRIAKEFGATIVLLAQTQRDMENAPVKDAMMNSLRGSGSIENASDIILLIGKVDTAEFPAAEVQPDAFRAIKVMKNRTGTPNRTINVEFEGMYQRFSDLNARPSDKLRAVGSLIPFHEVAEKEDIPVPDSPTYYAEQSELREQMGADPNTGELAW